MGLLGWIGLACVVVVIIVVCKVVKGIAWIFSSIANKARQANEERKREKEIRRDIRQDERQLRRERSKYEAEIAEYEKQAREAREKEQRRRNTICKFDDGISQDQFTQIVNSVTRRIKRISDTIVEGTIVYCTVRSQSKLTEWDFKIDYNDYGHLTGQYWLWSENDDSNIPEHVATDIRSTILDLREELLQNKERNNGNAKKMVHYCPRCGKNNDYRNPKYCTYCGAKLQ